MFVSAQYGACFLENLCTPYVEALRKYKCFESRNVQNLRSFSMLYSEFFLLKWLQVSSFSSR